MRYGTVHSFSTAEGSSCLGGVVERPGCTPLCEVLLCLNISKVSTCKYQQLFTTRLHLHHVHTCVNDRHAGCAHFMLRTFTPVSMHTGVYHVTGAWAAALKNVPPVAASRCATAGAMLVRGDCEQD